MPIDRNDNKKPNENQRTQYEISEKYKINDEQRSINEKVVRPVVLTKPETGEKKPRD